MTFAPCLRSAATSAHKETSQSRRKLAACRHRPASDEPTFTTISLALENKPLMATISL